MSDMPSVEQSPTIKISQQDLERTISIVARKAQKESGKPLGQPETALTPTAGDCIKSSDAVVTESLRKTLPEKARKILELSIDTAKKSIGKTTLAFAALSFLISSGCGNMEKPFSGSVLRQNQFLFLPLQIFYSRN